MGVSVYWPLSALCVFVLMCVMLNQSTYKKPHYVSDLCKLHIKVLLVLRYQGSTCGNPYYHEAKGSDREVGWGWGVDRI